MIKPIVYRNIEEKAALESKLMAAIPDERREAASRALMDIFSSAEKKSPVSKSRKK
jgi:hypothetical protein